MFDQVQGRYCEVKPFDKTIGTIKKIPIVDATITYDYLYTMQTHILIVRNALYVPTSKHNLIPPFLMREAGLIVNDVPKIHFQDSQSTDHAIIFPDDDLRIPLLLSGTFSYFKSCKPIGEDIDDCDPLFFITRQ